MSPHEHLLNRAVASLKQMIQAATELVTLYEHGAVTKIVEHNNSVETKILHIKSIVCLQFDVSVQDLEGNSRVRNIKDARHVAMYLIKQTIPRLDNETIGAHFGKRDASTVAHVMGRMKAVMQAVSIDPMLRTTIHHLKTLV